MGSEQSHSNNIMLSEQRRWRDYVLPPRSTHMLLNSVDHMAHCSEAKQNSIHE